MKPIKNKFILLFSPHSAEGGRRVIPLSLLAISTFLADDYDIRIFQSYICSRVGNNVSRFNRLKDQQAYEGPPLFIEFARGRRAPS